MLHTKALQNTLAKLEHSDRELISKHFNHLWNLYHNEVSYYKTLWLDGKICKYEYDQVAIPKLRNIRNELMQTAKILGRI